MAENIRFETTTRNKSVLVTAEGFGYIVHRAARDPGTEYWTCEDRDRCPARGISRQFRHHFEKTKDHTHLPDPVRLEVRRVQYNIKQAAGNAVGANTTTNVLQAGLVVASDAAKAILPNMDHLKRNIQRIRNIAQVPLPLPDNRDDIQIPVNFQVNGNIIRPEQFLLWDSGAAVVGQKRILMFGTEKNLQFLRNCNSLLMDGTFKSTPPHFVQIYTIHGTRPEPPNNRPGIAVPLIFALLPDKTEATYLRLINHLGGLMPEGWALERLMLDFERAMINALIAQWPNAQISGCFFHLNQNIWKKIQELGLSVFDGEDVENATNFKMISALAMVPPADVIQSWEDLLQILQPWVQLQPQARQDKINDLFTYFEVNYIGQIRAGIRIAPRVAPVELWNVYQRTIDYYGRTDNEVEGFHVKVKQTTGAQHPNLWKFLKSLQGLQGETEKLIEEMNAGAVGRKQRAKYIRVAERIRNVVLTWPRRQNLKTYLRGISHNYNYGGR